MCNDMDYDKKTELFQKETGIWPPGRDMPAAMCGGEDIFMTRQRAYEYWRKTTNRIKEIEAEVNKMNQWYCDMRDEHHKATERIKELGARIKYYESRPASIECPKCKIKIKTV